MRQICAGAKRTASSEPSKYFHPRFPVEGQSPLVRFRVSRQPPTQARSISGFTYAHPLLFQLRFDGLHQFHFENKVLRSAAVMSI